jgi:hypothetical protein
MGRLEGQIPAYRCILNEHGVCQYEGEDIPNGIKVEPEVNLVDGITGTYIPQEGGKYLCRYNYSDRNKRNFPCNKRSLVRVYIYPEP